MSSTKRHEITKTLTEIVPSDFVYQDDTPVLIKTFDTVGPTVENQLAFHIMAQHKVLLNKAKAHDLYIYLFYFIFLMTFPFGQASFVNLIKNSRFYIKIHRK